MDNEKVKRGLKVIREMAELIEDILAVKLLLELNAGITRVDQDIFQKVETWLNQVYGNAGGYLHEFKTYYKHRVSKSREVQRGHYADVTITNAQGVAKAVQLKSTIQNDPAAVTQMIAAAANQLSGERGEMPSDNQRRVIDVVIRNPSNPWPFTEANRRGTKTEQEIITKASSVISEALKNYTKHNSIKPGNAKPSAGKGLSDDAPTG